MVTFSLSTIISPPFCVIGSVAVVLRCHLLRTASRKSGGESTLFARLDVPQNLRADTDSSAVHCLNRPAEDGSFP